MNKQKLIKKLKKQKQKIKKEREKKVLIFFWHYTAVDKMDSIPIIITCWPFDNI